MDYPAGCLDDENSQINQICQALVLTKEWEEAQDTILNFAEEWAPKQTGQHPYMRAALIDKMGLEFAHLLTVTEEEESGLQHFLDQPYMDKNMAGELRGQAAEQLMAALPLSTCLTQVIEGKFAELLDKHTSCSPQTKDQPVQMNQVDGGPFDGKKASGQDNSLAFLPKDEDDDGGPKQKQPFARSAQQNPGSAISEEDQISRMLLALSKLKGFGPDLSGIFQENIHDDDTVDYDNDSSVHCSPQKDGFHLIEENIWASMVGHILPTFLRQQLWKACLFDRSKHKACLVTLAGHAAAKGVPDPARTAFADLIRRGVARTVDARALPTAIVEGAVGGRRRENIKATMSRLLNRYYILSGRHSSRNITLAFPLVLAFCDENLLVDELELLTMFDCLIRYYIPDTEQQQGDDEEAFLAEVAKDLAERDRELFIHCTVNFPAEAGAAAAAGLALHPALGRRWRRDLGVGLLRAPAALLFAWDHLFLLGWGEQLSDFWADFLILMRSELLATLPSSNVASSMLDGEEAHSHQQLSLGTRLDQVFDAQEHKVPTRNHQEMFRARHPLEHCTFKLGFRGRGGGRETQPQDQHQQRGRSITGLQDSNNNTSSNGDDTFDERFERQAGGFLRRSMK